MINKLFVALLLVSLLPIAAQAQGPTPLAHRSWEVSIFGGASYINGRSFQTPAAGESQQPFRAVGLKYATGSQMGLRLTENRWKHWGAAMEYTFSNQPLRFTNLSDTVPSLALPHSIHRFSYDVLYYPMNSLHRLRPFVFAGTGVSLYYIKNSAKEAAAAQGIQLNDPWKFAMRWGGGAKYLIRDQLAVSVQYSDSISGVPHYGLPAIGYASADQFVAGFRPDGVLHNHLISVGFNYQFGGK